MKGLLTARSELHKLGAEQQKKFEQFYHRQMSRELLPILADFNIALLIIGAFYGVFNHIAALPEDVSALGSFHPLTYLYWTCIATFAVLNRYSSVRHRAPLMIYMTTTTLMLFGYRSFILTGGDIDPIFGLYFYSAFLGMATASVKHTLRIQSLNVGLLALSYMVIAFETWFSSFISMLFNWFIFHCLLMSVTAAVFSQWMFKNLYASQFMLNHKNELLEESFKNLRKTETLLVQQQKYQALSHMAKGLLHEIINPVNSASQVLAFAQSINQDDDVSEALEEALLQQKRISNIITDLRVYAEPEYANQLQTEAVLDLVQLSLRFCKREIEKAEITVECNVADGLNLRCHPNAVTQVLVNIVLNAVEAMNAKDKNRRCLTIEAEESDEHVQIVVRDTGKGIKKDKLDRVLDPFFTDQSSPERMGLGLSICQTIMRHHSGSISVDSEFGEWTEMTLSFPYIIQLPGADRDVSENDLTDNLELRRQINTSKKGISQL